MMIDRGAMRLRRTIDQLRVNAAFSVAAIPGLTRPPVYRASQPIRPKEIWIFAIGSALIVMFGILVMLLWNRFGERK